MTAKRPARARRHLDPNQAAHAVGDAAVGAAEPKHLPVHVLVSGDTVKCERCGATFALSRRAASRASELRGFGAIHEHEKQAAHLRDERPGKG